MCYNAFRPKNVTIGSSPPTEVNKSIDSIKYTMGLNGVVSKLAVIIHNKLLLLRHRPIAGNFGLNCRPPSCTHLILIIVVSICPAAHVNS